MPAAGAGATWMFMVLIKKVISDCTSINPLTSP